jgi:two-component system, OmpR family, KDP operon response regulator KdpE
MASAAIQHSYRFEPEVLSQMTSPKTLTSDRPEWSSNGSSATRILLVDGDRNIVDLIRSNLAVRGYDVVASADSHKVLWQVDVERPDLVLLDLTLPGADGLDLCRGIRERSAVGIIVVSGRRAEHDKVQALNLGADDYITKPFGVEELLARITATLRRTRPPEPPAALPTAITVGNLVIDLEAQLVTRKGEAVHLTPTEFHLLRELVLNRGRLLSHATLLRRVWGVGYETETEYVRVYVRRLRSKLEGPGCPPLIMTVPRAGYRFIGD